MKCKESDAFFGNLDISLGPQFFLSTSHFSWDSQTLFPIITFTFHTLPLHVNSIHTKGPTNEPLVFGGKVQGKTTMSPYT